MTADEKIKKANKWRAKEGVSAIGRPQGLINSTDDDGWNGDFLVPLEGEVWRVRISDGMGWRHLSVTNAYYPKKMADWNVMCRLKDAFFADDAWVVQFHPPRDDNVNNHPYCLHLWEPTYETLPVPLPILV